MGTLSVQGAMNRTMADGAIPHLERDVAALFFRRRSAPRFDCGYGVGVACDVAVDHFRADVQRLAAAAAAAVLGGIVRGRAREQAEGAPAVDESSLPGALQLFGGREGEILVGIAG